MCELDSKLTSAKRMIVATCLVIVLITMSLSAHQAVVSAASATGSVMLVWSNQYRSPNVTDTSLLIGSAISLEVNVSMAPEFNAFDITLLFDARFLNFSGLDVSTGTVFGSDANIITRDAAIPGQFRLAVVS